ncbi:MAG TPA: hypothetical protein VGL56_13295 [Fimbriimonadaceae bacterium]|jgi:hypothetical protein
MLLPFVLAIAISAQSQNVADYFPVNPGTKWTLSQDSDRSKDEVIYTALAPVKVGKLMANPIQFSEQGVDRTLYYRLDGQALLTVDPNQPGNDPHPLIRMNTPSNKWHFDYLQETEPINVDGELQKLGKRNVLGTERDVLMVILRVKMGNKSELQITQTTYYAQGLGMYQMDMEQTQGNSHHRATQTLTKFEPSTSK